MKKILCIIGSDQRRGAYGGAIIFENRLKSESEVEFEYVFLKDYHLEYCCGCKLCFDQGEGLCPFKDDRDILIAKLEEADGVLIAVPNYAFSLSARLKNLFDRMAFILHRPRFFNKTFSVIVSQGVFGGDVIRKYIENIGSIMGFDVVRGALITTLEPMTEKQSRINKAKIEKAAVAFCKGLKRRRPTVPSFYKLMVFRMHRSSIRCLGEAYYDYRYMRDLGWFESNYYYPVKLDVLKRLWGNVCDFFGNQMGKRLNA